jgi:hypothetical protein
MLKWLKLEGKATKSYRKVGPNHKGTSDMEMNNRVGYSLTSFF